MQLQRIGSGVQGGRLQAASTSRTLPVAQPRRDQVRGQALSTKQQEQQDRWWSAGQVGGAGSGEEARPERRRAAAANDWEEERGRGLTDYVSTYAAADRGSSSQNNRRDTTSSARWSSSGGRSSRGSSQQQQQQQQGPGYLSSVNRVWHSSDWKPARGRRVINEETDVDSDSDELSGTNQQQQRRGGSGNLSRSSLSSKRSGGKDAAAAAAAAAWVDGEEEQEDEDWVEAGPGRGEGSAGDLSRRALRGEALYGVHPILNALLQGRRTPHTLYILAGMDLSKRKDARAVRQALALAQELGVKISKVSRHELNTLSADKVHQGLVLDCSPLAFTHLDKLPPADAVMKEAAAAGAPPPVWVALDEVLDPQNFGAILRSCWCLGAAGMLVSAKNCAPLSPAVSKASAGAMEAAEVHAAKMLRDTLVGAAASGWLVLGAAGDAAAQSCQDVNVDRPTIIVLGNEGRGLRTNIRRVCTGLVRVDMGMQGRGFTGLGSPGHSASSNGVPGLSSSAHPSTNANNRNSGMSSGPSYWGGSTESGGEEGSSPDDFWDDRNGEGDRVQRGGQKGSPSVDSLNVSVATGILLHSLTAAAARHSTKQSSNGRS